MSVPPLTLFVKRLVPDNFPQFVHERKTISDTDRDLLRFQKVSLCRLNESQNESSPLKLCDLYPSVPIVNLNNCSHELLGKFSDRSPVIRLPIQAPIYDQYFSWHKSYRAKDLISKRELWGTTPKQPLERNRAAKESLALQTLCSELKEINSEKLTGVYFALYDGSF